VVGVKVGVHREEGRVLMVENILLHSLHSPSEGPQPIHQDQGSDLESDPSAVAAVAVDGFAAQARSVFPSHPCPSSWAEEAEASPCPAP
jgi:hypothetical protein